MMGDEQQRDRMPPGADAVHWLGDDERIALLKCGDRVEVSCHATAWRVILRERELEEMIRWLAAHGFAGTVLRALDVIEVVWSDGRGKITLK